MHHRPRKRFGQHFLHDRAIVERIVASLAPGADDLLVEIGPGHGALTVPVLACGATLHVVEIDRDLAASLQARCATPKLIVHNADALRFDFAALAGDRRKLRLFGNLPYNIATELVFRLLPAAARIQDMLFMVQREVAERMVAAPGAKARGRLSVMTQARCDVEKLFTVASGAFTPPPAVESAVVRVVPLRRPRLGSDAATFADIVRAAFQQRRKTVRNALRGYLAEGAIRAAGVDPRARAETLANAAFVSLAEQLARQRATTGSHT